VVTRLGVPAALADVLPTGRPAAYAVWGCGPFGYLPTILEARPG